MVPYDDCPSLSSDEDHLSLAASSAATIAGGGGWTTSLSSSSSSGPSSSSSSPPSYALAAAAAADPAAYLAGFGGVAVDAGVIRGGDVVRLCHLRSTGFLTCEAFGSVTPLGEEARPAGRQAAAMDRFQRGGGRAASDPAAAEREARGEGGGGGAGAGPFLYISATPHRRQKLQNASSKCLWVLERTHCALGGRPLRGSFSSAASAIDPQQGGGGGGAHAYSSASSSSKGGGNADRGVLHGSSSPRSASYAAGSPLPVSGGGDGGSGVPERRRRQHSDAGLVSGSDTGAPGSGGGGGASGARPSSFFTSGGDRDSYAETVAEGRRRQGAGDAVEHVRIKHLPTMRYLCVGEQCDGGAEAASTAPGGGAVGTRRRGESRKEGGAAATAAATTRVGMLTVDRHAAVPAATVFAIRPRAAGAGAARAAAAARWLGPDDLVHLQHKDTGLFLSALPLEQEVAGESIGLTMVDSPLTSEARWGVTWWCGLFLVGGGHTERVDFSWGSVFFWRHATSSNVGISLCKISWRNFSGDEWYPLLPCFPASPPPLFLPVSSTGALLEPRSGSAGLQTMF